MQYLDYNETPVQEIYHPLLTEKAVRLFVKREDLNHPLVSGNKWWKLKYNLLQARAAGKKRILTFGGAYSNHIYATAAAARALGFESIGVIRGEEVTPHNSTLAFARGAGMRLHFVSRLDYKRKTEPEFLEALGRLFGDFFLIPEGGTNTDAIRGTLEFAQKLGEVTCDEIFVPVGTAGTIAGLIVGLSDTIRITGVPVFRFDDRIYNDLTNLLLQYSGLTFGNWRLLPGYHFGGYAKTTDALLAFIEEMKHQCDLPLDHVYTGKLLCAIFSEIAADQYTRGTTLLAVHTGGTR